MQDAARQLQDRLLLVRGEALREKRIHTFIVEKQRQVEVTSMQLIHATVFAKTRIALLNSWPQREVSKPQRSRVAESGVKCPTPAFTKF